jgi:hypothetical protein
VVQPAHAAPARPFTLSDAYFDICFDRIRAATHALHRVLAGSME